MKPGTRFWSAIFLGGSAAAGVLIVVGLAGAFLCSTEIWLVGMRSGLTLLGLVGLAYGALAVYGWLELRAYIPVARDRSADALPVPAELADALEELRRLGFVRVGQTETGADNAERPRVTEVLALPSDPWISGELSFSRPGTCLASFLMDGRVVETYFPPLDLAKMKLPKGWRPLPDWVSTYDCADGVEPALGLHRSCVAFEAARGFPALPIPGLQSLLHWQNAGLLRIREFHRHQYWMKTRGALWVVPLSLVFLWMGAFATWS